MTHICNFPPPEFSMCSIRSFKALVCIITYDSNDTLWHMSPWHNCDMSCYLVHIYSAQCSAEMAHNLVRCPHLPKFPVWDCIIFTNCKIYHTVCSTWPGVSVVSLPTTAIHEIITSKGAFMLYKTLKWAQVMCSNVVLSY